MVCKKSVYPILENIVTDIYEGKTVPEVATLNNDPSWPS
jgi:hypothetical protein